LPRDHASGIINNRTQLAIVFHFGAGRASQKEQSIIIATLSTKNWSFRDFSDGTGETRRND
jgi:hypothetical protein